MSVNTVKQRLQDCYSSIMLEAELTSGAKKDIVGKHYELFREIMICSHAHLDVATKLEKENFNKMFGNNYKADQYIVDKRSRSLLALEEDKGHYVDKCFAKRALWNAMETIAHCLQNDIDVPYFILSCPTNYNLKPLVSNMELVFKKELLEELRAKFRFFPLCDHGRTSRNKYLVEKQMPFKLKEDFVVREIEFMNSLGTI
tara:strand:- start:26 stop:628 length:603 start_codon:yes stop_codon:yes gene_type:complete